MKLGRLIGIARLAVLAAASAVFAIGIAGAQTSSTTIAERAAFFDKLAAEKSTKALEESIRAALAVKTEPSPSYVLEALFDRYAELDTAAAARFASELPGVPGNVIQSLYRRLASSNPNAALAALSLLEDADVARIVAMTILRALREDVASIELVAAAMHTGNADLFRSDALIDLKSIPPRDAFAEALRLRDVQARNTAASFIIARWADSAPNEAMTAVEQVPDAALSSMLRNNVLQRWNDTGSLVAYLNRLDDAGRRAAVADGVLYRIAEANPERAAEFVQSLSPGPERSAALQQVAISYAQKDDAAALEWARRLDPPQPQVVQSIISFVASREPLRAFDLVGALAEPARTQAYQTIVGSSMGRDQRQFEQLAARLAALPDGQTKQQLTIFLLTNWSQGPGHLKPALEWALAHATGLPAEAFMQLGYSLAQSDPEAASAYLDRVPPAARSSWIGVIASGYARSDPQRALAFVDRFRGDPAYDGAATTLVQQLASIDPPAAARLLATVGTRPPNGFGAEMQIAREWVQRDARSAATWALDLPQLQRSMAMAMVADAWGRADPSAARSWALALPAGERRDVALGAALRAQGPGAPDPALLAAFSDDRQRQGALMTTIIMTAGTDAPLARRVIDEHITDPQLRARALELVETAARGGFPTTPTGVVRSPVTGLPVQTGFATGPSTIIGAASGTIVTSPTGFSATLPTAPLPLYPPAPTGQRNDAPAVRHE